MYIQDHSPLFVATTSQVKLSGKLGYSWPPRILLLKLTVFYRELQPPESANAGTITPILVLAAAIESKEQRLTNQVAGEPGYLAVTDIRAPRPATTTRIY